MSGFTWKIIISMRNTLKLCLFLELLLFKIARRMTVGAHSTHRYEKTNKKAQEKFGGILGKGERGREENKFIK